MNIATALMKLPRVSTISYRRILYCHPRLPCAIRLPPIDALAQHRKLGARQRHGPAGCLRPHELAAVKALLEKTNSIAVMPKNLYEVTSPATKKENLARQRTLIQCALHQAAQAGIAAAQIRDSSHQPDLRVGRDHPRKLFTTARTISASTAPSTLTSVRPGNSMLIVTPGAGLIPSSGSVSAGCSSLTETGNSRTCCSAPRTRIELTREGRNA